MRILDTEITKVGGYMSTVVLKESADGEIVVVQIENDGKKIAESRGDNVIGVTKDAIGKAEREYEQRRKEEQRKEARIEAFHDIIG